MDDQIKKALQDAGLGHLEDDVLLEIGLIEATAVAETVIQKRKEAHGEDRNKSGVSNSEGRQRSR